MRKGIGALSLKLFSFALTLGFMITPNMKVEARGDMSVPTELVEVGDYWFISDCYSHRILYTKKGNVNETKSFDQWTPVYIYGSNGDNKSEPHSIAANKDNNRIVVTATLSGQLVELALIDGEWQIIKDRTVNTAYRRPHYIERIGDVYYVLCSGDDTSNSEGSSAVVETYEMDDAGHLNLRGGLILNGSNFNYVRSFSIDEAENEVIVGVNGRNEPATFQPDTNGYIKTYDLDEFKYSVFTGINPKKSIMLAKNFRSPVQIIRYTGTKREDVTTTEKTKDVMIVGDSRTVHTLELGVINPRYKVIAESGKQYGFLEEKRAEIEDFAHTEGAVIISNMGINDITNGSNNDSKYEKFYRDLSRKMAPNAKLYLVSVNPVEEDVLKSCYSRANNEVISAFNAQLKSIADSLPNVEYIDTFSSFVGKSGISKDDGLHYTEDVYKQIYNMIMKNVNFEYTVTKSAGFQNNGENGYLLTLSNNVSGGADPGMYWAKTLNGFSKESSITHIETFGQGTEYLNYSDCPDPHQFGAPYYMKKNSMGYGTALAGGTGNPRVGAYIFSGPLEGKKTKGSIMSLNNWAVATNGN